MSKKPAKSDEHELSFEEALAQVESIIERIEGGEVGLEASVAEYEKGVALIRRCRDVLTKAEQRVEQLNKDLLDQGAKSEGGKSDPARSKRPAEAASESAPPPDADEEDAPF